MELLSTSIYNSFARVSITLYIPPWERYKTFLSYHISSYLASSKIPDHTCWPGWSKVLPWICLQIQCHCWWLHTQAAQHMFLRNGWVVQTNQPDTWVENTRLTLTNNQKNLNCEDFTCKAIIPKSVSKVTPMDAVDQFGTHSQNISNWKYIAV